MNINKDELKEKYRDYYKQVILDKSDSESVTDSITGLNYLKTLNEDLQEAKKRRALVKIVDEYRTDLPCNWKDYLNIHFREKIKLSAHEQFKDEILESLDLLIKAYWGKNINLLNKNLDNVLNIVSYDEYASHFTATILLEKKATNSWDKAFRMYGLYGSPEFLEKAADYMIKRFKPVPFEKMKMFPGKTMLKDKEIIMLSMQSLDKGNAEQESKYIDLVKSIEFRKSKFRNM